MSSSGLISVLLVQPPLGYAIENLKLEGKPQFEEAGFHCRVAVDDAAIPRLLADEFPHVIVTFGRAVRHLSLEQSSIEVRRRWIHFDEPPAPAALAESITHSFVDVVTKDRFPATPLISVFTPTYNTGMRLLRPYRSLVNQTYANWEWVVLDDSPDDLTMRELRAIAAEDWRVRVYKPWRSNGSIGDVKRDLCGLARGNVLVELDHDDALMPNCLADVVEAFQKFPDAGFAFTDCAEIFEDGEPAVYGPVWALGFGYYRYEAHEGNDFVVGVAPPVNGKTMRHIVGVPNHVRAWKRDVYEDISGHARGVHVCDDYELLIRTFLKTRMVHIRRLGYVQYMSRVGSNTQRKRNREIQRLVRLFRDSYGREIHERLDELGLDDWVWKDGLVDFNVPTPVPVPNAHYELR